jgi:pimeloyl-ACP methyl ester carboxylesterase
MTDRLANNGGIHIASQAFGDMAKPTVLLIMGSMASMLWWPDEFCERLAARNLSVLRYDNRDTGRSTIYAPGAASYTLNDMADDAFNVLDAWNIKSAHIVGMSLGGTIAQIAALQHPERSLSLTVISSTPLGADAAGLPPPDAEYLKHAAQFEKLDWSNRGEVVHLMVDDARQIAGSAHPFDERRSKSLIERDFDRARNFGSAINHWSVKPREGWRGRLSDLTTPLLVIHGTDDPVFPLPHGIALAEATGTTSLIRLEGGGHELHEADWDFIIDAIVNHTAHG